MPSHNVMGYKVVVIGGGPGGYVSAIRLSQLGVKTAVVESHLLGGECTNYGCIPTKSFIKSVNIYWNAKKGSEVGVLGDVRYDFASFKLWKDKVVSRVRDGVRYLCEENNVNILEGEAYIKSPTRVEVKGSGQDKTLDVEKIVVATGSSPTQLPNIPYDGRYIISSKDLLQLDRLPDRILVIGGGVIGIEFGVALAKLGVQVTVVEMMDQILPGFDPEVVRYATRFFSKLGVRIHTKSIVSDYRVSGNEVEATIRKQGEDVKVNVDSVLVAVGRRPNSNIGLKEIGVQLDPRGHVITDESMRTNLPNVYAVGDVVGAPYLAHKAFKQGLIAAESIAGVGRGYSYKAVPSVVYSSPEIAFTGLTEEEAKKVGYQVLVGRFPFTASARALTESSAEGYVKIVVDKETGKVVGAQMIGPEVSELISELALAIESGINVEEIALTMHPHPTLSEALMEAAEDALGRPIHTLKRRV
ncbi:MAG: dihydrolipoyl dehydrogenase [Nitrososphaeria archaeon]